MQSNNSFTKIFFLLLAISVGFVSCKSTNTNVSENNTIQEELVELDEAVENEIQPIGEPMLLAQLTPEEEKAIKLQSLSRDQKVFYEIAHTYDYLEVGEGLLKESYRVTGYDIQSSEGVEYVSVDPIYEYDLSAPPAKQQGDDPQDFYWLEGGGS